MSEKKEYIIAVDFDGVLFTNKWPDIGEPMWENISRLREEKRRGRKLILWSCRSGDLLVEAVKACKEVGIIFDAINCALPSMIAAFGNDTRKIFANEYWDDHGVCKGFDTCPVLELATLEDAIKTYGEQSQILVAVEELSELQKALLKWIRAKNDKHVQSFPELLANIKEEMADVEIMLEQMKFIFGPCNYEKDTKLMRLRERLRNE